MAKKTDKATHKKKAPAPKKKAAARPAAKKPAKAKAKPAPKKVKAAPAKKKVAPKKAAPKKAAAPAKPAAAKAAPKPKVPVKAAPPKAAAPKAAALKPAAPKPAAPKVAAPKVPTAPAKATPPKAEAKSKAAPKAAKKSAPDDAEVLTPDDQPAEEIVLTDAEGRRYCRVKDCDQIASVDGYCRFHYLLYWKKIQIRKKILSEGKLERYVEDLTARYPDKFLDMLRKDLRSEKEFLAAIQELEIDESATDSEFEDESANYIEEVRGMGEGGGSGRDDEDF